MLAGRYEIVELIGQGGMGIVFSARHVRLERQVAIKWLRPDAAKDEEVVRRFDREARAAAQLHGPNVARIVDVDSTEEGMPFIVMEYLQGYDLDELLDRQGTVPPTEAVDYVLQACSAMAEAHALGIIHRDLKPNNLFVDTTSGVPLVKVLDFGISKVMLPGENKSMTQTSSTFGTPTYMSPDQIQSAKNVDGRADIWSLGVILYELITGRPPFEGENATAIIWSICADEPPSVAELAPAVSKELSDVVMTALEKDWEDRYEDIHALAEALEPFGSPGAWAPPTNLGVPPPRTSGRGAVTLDTAPTVRVDKVTSRSWSTPRVVLRRRNQRTVVATFAALLLGVVGVVVAIAFTAEESPPATKVEAEGASRPAAPEEVPAAVPTVAVTPQPTGEPSVRATAEPTADPSASAKVVDRPPAPPSRPPSPKPGPTATVTKPKPAPPAPKSAPAPKPAPTDSGKNPVLL